MSALTSKKLVDKNGILTTRHVKDGSSSSQPNRLTSIPTAPDVVTTPTNGDWILDESANYPRDEAYEQRMDGLLRAFDSAAKQ